MNHKISTRTISVFFFILSQLGCSSLPYSVAQEEIEFSETGSEIYIVSHGWHTGVVVPAKHIQQRIPALKTRFGDTKYLEIGWGDKGFYQANTITSALTMRAIFWPTDSIIHTVAVPKRPDKYFPHAQVSKICLDRDSYSGLLSFIQKSFHLDERGDVIVLQNGLYGDAQFYDAVGNYYLMNTCNKWTAKALQSANTDIFPLFKLTAGSIMSFAKVIEVPIDQPFCAATQ